MIGTAFSLRILRVITRVITRRILKLRAVQIEILLRNYVAGAYRGTSLIRNYPP